MNKTQILKEKIADAELVLIGIGEEFNESFSRINQYPRLLKGLDEIDSDESIAWAVPFLEKVYLEQEGEAETVLESVKVVPQTLVPCPATDALPFSVNITCSSMYSYLANSWVEAHKKKEEKQNIK